MVTDYRGWKIDMVITKSISRFARNTVTLLQTVREFKTLEVDIYFEEQNIHTMSGDGELMMTILASYAQEESHEAIVDEKTFQAVQGKSQGGRLGLTRSLCQRKHIPFQALWSAITAAKITDERLQNRLLYGSAIHSILWGNPPVRLIRYRNPFFSR